MKHDLNLTTAREHNICLALRLGLINWFQFFELMKEARTKGLLLVLAFILTACGGSGGGGGGGSGGAGPVTPSACADGALTGVFRESGGELLSIAKCAFVYGVGGGCELDGTITNTSNASGSITLTFTSTAGTCGTIPATTQCGFSFNPTLANGTISLTCAELGTNEVYTRL